MFTSPSIEENPSAALELAVSVTEPRDATVDSTYATDKIAAELRLKDESGLMEQRSIRAADCGVLHSAIAVILASFAQRSERDTEAGGAVNSSEKLPASELGASPASAPSVSQLPPLSRSTSSRVGRRQCGRSSRHNRKHEFFLATPAVGQINGSRVSDRRHILGDSVAPISIAT